MTWLLLLVSATGFGPALEFTTEDRCERARTQIVEVITNEVIDQAQRHPTYDDDARRAAMIAERQVGNTLLVRCIPIEK